MDSILPEFGNIDIILIIFSIIPLLILNLTTLFNIIFGPYLRKEFPLSNSPKVSVLIPARNEVNNIKNCIKSILEQDYSDFELIVLDDNSDDGTYELLCELQFQHPKLTVVKGKELPDDWLGKNWACHQLSQYANGDIFIFTDADNKHSPIAITRTVAYIQRYGLDFASAFPQQITNSFSEKLIVPMIDLIIYSGLPLWATRFVPHKAFAAANGQWIAMIKDAYLKSGGHSAVRQEIAEDVALSKLFKSLRFKILTMIGTDVVYCRMYTNLHEIRQGLSKNLFALAGFNTAVFIILLMLGLSSTVMPFVFLLFGIHGNSLFLSIMLNLMLRFLQALAFRHNVMVSVILHPVSIIGTFFIALESLYRTKKGKNVWKERKIQRS
ncbi:MAG: glycosyltransferase [Desulfobulbaceae bacterium]|nr:glycosyltransferase [Desulfobulbaceae bacterium]